MEYRLAGAGGNWNDADCGDDGIVDGTSCVVSDLDEGTEYEFRVRGLPADDDDDHIAGAWAEVDGNTTGRQQTMTPGGMGDLNVTWESDSETSITFSWEPMAGVTYEWAPATGDMDDADPCEDAAFGDTTVTNAGSGSRFDTDVTVDATNPSAGLCVRIQDENLDDDEKATSFAWGIGKPDEPTAGAVTPNDDMNAAEALSWTEIEVKKGFEWELRLVSDMGRDNGDLSGEPGKDVQDACSAGTFVDQGDADLDLAFGYTWDGSIDAYSGYTLCVRYANTAGSTDWAVPLTGSDLNEIYTPPARPPSPSYQSSQSTTTGTAAELVWIVPVSGLSNVPREMGGYEAKTIHYQVRYNHDNDDATNMVSTPAPNSCEADAEPSNLESGATNPWTSTPAASIENDLDGVKVTSADTIGIPPNEQHNLGVRLCVRAIRGSQGGSTAINGPWVLSGTVTVTKQPAPPF